MAISIGDALLTLGIDTKDLDKGLKDTEGNLNKFGQSVQKGMLAIGGAFTAVGGSVLAMAGLSVKAYANEEAGIIKLQQALKNVGVSYDKVKASLEANITATQTKTAVADDQQREALAELVAITNSYDEALKLLPLTMDLATAKGMDMVMAAQIIGRVNEGNTTILTRYGIQLKEGATATEALGELQKKFGGQAEAYGKSTAGAMKNVQNSIGDLKESIGQALAPAINDLLQNNLLPMIRKFGEFVTEHPSIVKAVTAIGAAFTLLGTALIATSMAMSSKLIPNMIATIAWIGKEIAATWTLVAAKIALLSVSGPVGWALLAGAAAAALLAMGAIAALTWETPRMAEGGIVKSPTLALVGEGGPEAIIPLNKSMSNTVYVSGNNFYVREESDIDRIGKSIVDKIRARSGAKI